MKPPINSLFQLPEELLGIILKFTGNPLKYSIVNKLFHRIAYKKQNLLEYFNRPITQYKNIALKHPILGQLLLSTPKLHVGFNLYDYLQVVDAHQKNVFEHIQKNTKWLDALNIKDLLVLGKVNKSMTKFFVQNVDYHFRLNSAMGKSAEYLSSYLNKESLKQAKLNYIEEQGICEKKPEDINKDHLSLIKIFCCFNHSVSIKSCTEEKILSNLNSLIEGEKTIDQFKHTESIFYTLYLLPSLYSHLKTVDPNFFKKFETLYQQNLILRPNFFGAFYELRMAQEKDSNTPFKLNEREQTILSITDIVSKEASKEIDKHSNLFKSPKKDTASK